MTTIVLLVVIIVLTCNLAILYLPFEKRKKEMLSLITVGILFICCLGYNARNNKVPVQLCNKIISIDNPYAQKSMMATFNISEVEMQNLSEKTRSASLDELLQSTTHKLPALISFGVTVVLIFALVFTPLLIFAVRKNDDKDVKKIHQIAFCLNVVAAACLLSLYYGLKLALVPWIKKSDEEKSLPTSTTNVHLSRLT